jgi:hypothetical protein
LAGSNPKRWLFIPDHCDVQEATMAKLPRHYTDDEWARLSMRAKAAACGRLQEEMLELWLLLHAGEPDISEPEARAAVPIGDRQAIAGEQEG